MSASPVAPPEPDLVALERYFCAVSSACGAALARTGIVRRTLDIGGMRLEVRFAGEPLARRLLPAFAHLAAGDEQTPDAVLGVWDARSTDTDLPRPAWPGGTLARGLIPGYTGGAIRSALEPATSAFSIFHAERREGFFCVPDASTLHPHEASFPLRTLLNWTLGGRGLQLIHAGAVGTARGAALLTGMGGSGKSSTTLACLDAGLLFAGDDFVAVDVAAAEAFSLYATAKLFRADLARFPALGASISHPGGEGDDKAVFFLHPQFRNQLVRSLPLRCLLLPRVSGAAQTVIRPATAAEAVRRMAPSTMIHLPGSGPGAFRAMAQLAARLPSCFLELGTDRAEVVRAIRRFLDEGL